MKIFLPLVAIVALLCVTPARAECPVAEQVKYVEVEGGGTTDNLTQGREQWNGQYLQALAKNGAASTVFARAGFDQRFGQNDPSYEAGAYANIVPHVTANVDASFSPTHIVLPNDQLGGGLDWRIGDGYGLQAQYTDRTYPTQSAGITALGIDRYVGTQHFTAGVTFATLTGVPGTALTERIGYGRTYRCDAVSFTVANGRDVELIAPGSLGIYHTVVLDGNDVHWLTQHVGLDLGLGWYVLTGAYNRLEARFAVRERF